MYQIKYSRIFDDTELTKENKTSDKETELIGSKNNKDLLYDPLSRYMEFCKISAKNFEADILQNYSSGILYVYRVIVTCDYFSHYPVIY